MDQLFLRQSQERLLHHLFSPWQRRGTLLLQVGLEYGLHPEFFWDAGFDTTCVDSSSLQIEESRSRSGPRVEYTIGQADDLPFDDNSFDYTVILYHKNNMEEMLSEACRVSTRGMIVLAKNCLSLARYPFHVDKALHISSPVFPWTLFREVWDIESKKAFKISSILPMPRFLWKHTNSSFNKVVLPVPIGALMGMRLDFNKTIGTPLGLLAQAKRKAQEEQTAVHTMKIPNKQHNEKTSLTDK